MVRDFKSFNDFDLFLKRSPMAHKSEENKIIEESLTVTAEFIKKEAKEKFGEYQSGWDELAQATQADRARQGYTDNDPLLRSGHLRDTVEMNVHQRSASIGSNDPVMVWQEKGTTKTGWNGANGIPPRPVFLLTYFEHGEEAVKLFTKTYLSLIRGHL